VKRRRKSFNHRRIQEKCLHAITERPGIHVRIICEMTGECEKDVRNAVKYLEDRSLIWFKEAQNVGGKSAQTYYPQYMNWTRWFCCGKR